MRDSSDANSGDEGGKNTGGWEIVELEHTEWV